MTNSQILKKAIEKAENNGYSIKQFFPAFPPRKIQKRVLWNILWSQKEKIIFSHDFAKAFWGENFVIHGAYSDELVEAWEHHLMQMVLEEEPLKYIEKFL